MDPIWVVTRDCDPPGPIFQITREGGGIHRGARGSSEISVRYIIWEYNI